LRLLRLFAANHLSEMMRFAHLWNPSPEVK